MSWSCSWISLLEVLVEIRNTFFSSKEKMASSSAAETVAVETMACARQGRHRQRYEGCYRLVSGCIPYMLKEDEESSCLKDDHVLDRLQVLMISTPKRSDLIFPKGGWEDDESVDEAACREAFEEAGVKGNINVVPLGEWIFKSKSKQGSCGLEGACKGFMFALQVTELLESWPEQITHGRRWVPVEEAYSLSRYDWMREALDKLKEQMLFGSSFGVPPSPELPESSNLYMVVPPSVPHGAVAFC
ncbi:nudix hydrolase 13, mitochondrial isoform X1 [Brachypodium distachyon]|uniref:Nudix hydrolase domain-containing protein n=2 Tax=Brachypodium distachyon TaxID=15368 RepID=I1ILF1_BRADI|nr:nudix hydrolase 13, mitochondrial isoform X1 [Brachypodium distachyon]KQJ88351.1 hypothetical protein BRADI_4g17217v3 [Brachypodium distachyon]|eukprot:XP_003576011.1 nudix hydrolase 13, mitochondrial isoform X1 [Brachypodium distachyon]